MATGNSRISTRRLDLISGLLSYSDSFFDHPTLDEWLRIEQNRQKPRGSGSRVRQRNPETAGPLCWVGISWMTRIHCMSLPKIESRTWHMPTFGHLDFFDGDGSSIWTVLRLCIMMAERQEGLHTLTQFLGVNLSSRSSFWLNLEGDKYQDRFFIPLNYQTNYKQTLCACL